MVKVIDFPSWLPSKTQKKPLQNPEQSIVNFFALSNIPFCQAGMSPFRTMACALWNKSQDVSLQDFEKWIASFHRHSISTKIKVEGVNTLIKKLRTLCEESIGGESPGDW
jgi:hypothetical protein